MSDEITLPFQESDSEMKDMIVITPQGVCAGHPVYDALISFQEDGWQEYYDISELSTDEDTAVDLMGQMLNEYLHETDVLTSDEIVDQGGAVVMGMAITRFASFTIVHVTVGYFEDSMDDEVEEESPNEWD